MTKKKKTLTPRKNSLRPGESVSHIGRSGPTDMTIFINCLSYGDLKMFVTDVQPSSLFTGTALLAVTKNPPTVSKVFFFLRQNKEMNLGHREL